MTSVPEVNQAKEANEQALLAKPNVVGVGVGFKETAGRLLDKLAVKVLVTQKLPVAGLSARAVVPKQVNGVETDVMQVGVIRALQNRTDRWRPAPGGVSIGHYQITAGTLGCIVRDRSTGDRLILSNNHVLANSNDAQPGDPILQPGPYDGGSATDDIIGHLARFCPIEFEVQSGTCNLAGLYAGFGNLMAKLSGSTHRLQVFQANPQAENQVDAAVAKPAADSFVSDEILEIGTLNGTIQGTLGMEVRKSGRTTGFTTGSILVVNATVSVTYGAGRTARFVNQFVSGPMSQGGDSGSLVVAGDSPLAVGLLFAGSDQSTIFSPIQAVLDCLEVDIPAGGAGAAANPGVSMDQVQRVKDRHEAELMSKPNVVGVGVGYRERGGRKTDELSLVVMVERKMPETDLAPDDIVPKSIEGVPVDVQEVGQIRAQPSGS